MDPPEDEKAWKATGDTSGLPDLELRMCTGIRHRNRLLFVRKLELFLCGPERRFPRAWTLKEWLLLG